MTVKYKRMKQRRGRPSLQALAEQLAEERAARGHFLATIADLRRQLAREIVTNTKAARTITELRFAIAELFEHFERHTNGYTTAELNRLDEIRSMAPPVVPAVTVTHGATPAAAPPSWSEPPSETAPVSPVPK